MKKLVAILAVIMFIFAGCKQTKPGNALQSIELIKAQLGVNNILSKTKVEINKIPQILSVEANVEIAKATVKVIASDSSFLKYECESSDKTFVQSIEDFREGENTLKIVLEAKNGKVKEFEKKIVYSPTSLPAVVYVDEAYNQVKNQDQLIAIKDSKAKVFVKTAVPLIGATLDDGSLHEMTIDKTNEATQTTASFVLPISSKEKTVNIKAKAKGYKEFSISFRLVQGMPPVTVVKAMFNSEEFYFDNKNTATIENPEISFNSGKIMLEFHTKEDLNVDIVSTTHGYVDEVVEGSGVKGDVGERKKLKLINDKQFMLEIIILGSATTVKLKISAKDCVETDYTIQINTTEKEPFPASSKYSARNAYSNQETAFTTQGFVWPYVSDDHDNVYLYKTMGDLIAVNFEFEGSETEYYVFTRLKDKNDGEKKDGAWVKWGPSRYVEEWTSSILNLRQSSQEKVEFYIDGFIGTEFYEACPLVPALFKRMAKGGLVLEAFTIQGNTAIKNMGFARTQRFYKKMLHAFDVNNPAGLKIKAKDNALTASSDYLFGYWTSTKEIEKVECKISVQDKPEDVPSVVEGWNRIAVKYVPATSTDFARIHMTRKATNGLDRFVFQSAKIYTIELFIKVKGESEEVKGKYVIDYRYS